MTAQLMLRMGEDLAAMRSGVNLTARVLRGLMHVPVSWCRRGSEALRLKR